MSREEVTSSRQLTACGHYATAVPVNVSVFSRDSKDFEREVMVKSLAGLLLSIRNTVTELTVRKQ